MPFVVNVSYKEMNFFVMFINFFLFNLTNKADK